MQNTKPTVLVLGTRGKGGILSVIDGIARSALAQTWHLRHLASHDSGGMFKRLALAAMAGWQIVWCGLTRRASLLHLHAAMKGSFWRKAIFLRLGHAVGLPGVFHLHGSEMKLFYAAQGAFGRRMIARTFSQADRVIVLSESWQRFVHEVAPQARVSVVFNFVDLPAAVGGRPRQQGEPLRIVFLGLIGDRKGVFDLLRAVRQVEDTRPGQLRLLVGGNGEVDRLRHVVAESGLGGCVEVLGWVGAERRRALLSEGHALALPSYNEGLPMALLEAMAHGLPVLTTDVGGIPELVAHGVQGHVVKPGDMSAMVACITSWLDDDAQRVRMGQAGRARVQRDFSAAASVARIDAIYKDVCRGGSGGAA